MITFKNDIIHLTTNHTAYIMKVTPSGLLLHNYYGPKVEFVSFEIIEQKLDGGVGNACLYEGVDQAFLDNLDLELSFIGKGDFRESLLSLYHDELGFVNNFKYQGYELISDQKEVLPKSFNPDQVLRIDLYDEYFQVKLELYYKIYEASDVITKYLKVINQSDKTITINRLLSNQLDLPDHDYVMMTFDGAWSKERHLHEKRIESGIYISDSKCGTSSETHNPFFILRRPNTCEDSGEAIGFNLVYSGNHLNLLETTATKKLRVLTGINDHAFKLLLHPQETYMAPEAVLTYTKSGLNQLSQNMHDFINHHIIKPQWQNYIRPILINNWEATYFNFNEKKLVQMAKIAAGLGIELFVLDDGWFGKRNDDKSSLGDWFVNYDKLPSGLKGLSEKINQLGMKFGLWVEPEMISVNSKLYREHPEYAVAIPGVKPSVGRNQLLIDLTNPEVRKYLVETLSNVFASCNLDYVKWDFNRKITDIYGSTLSCQGEFFYHYYLGLYEVIDTLTTKFPKILFEACASGGSRFDLGLMCYMPQVWTSDDTDYYERLLIQTGTSYGYPQSTMGCHVSAVPNHQTLRNTPLSSRFNLACFGVLGYELDVTALNNEELVQVKKQVALYKKYRELLQFGRFYRGHKSIYHENNTYFYVHNGTEGVIGFFQGLIHPCMPEDVIKVCGLQKDVIYEVKNKKERVNIKVFGGLINLVLPIKIKLNGKIHHLISKVYRPHNGNECYRLYGETFEEAGIRLKQQFMGTGFNEKVRVVGDFGSRLYFIKKDTSKKG